MIAAAEIASQLQNRIRRLERPQPTADEDKLSSGWPPLDRLLPGGGLYRGSLVEWLDAGMGSGAAMLALGGVRQAAKDGGAVVVVDRASQFYPPAIAAWELDLNRVIFVHPRNRKDELWAWDQALRCPGVAAVWGGIEQIDSRWFRRLQLSAESNGCLGVLIRPGQARVQPTWSRVRFWVESQPARRDRRLRVELLHCRGAGRGGSVQLVMDEWNGRLCEVRERHETHSRALAAQLAHTEARSRPTGTWGARRSAL
jgi:protein ImuA